MSKLKSNNHFLKKVVLYASVGCLAAASFDAMAVAQDLGGVASTITSSFGKVAKLITAGSYMAGLAFAIGAIMKFKQHKDNPTQIPIGTPISLLFIAAALLFLPSILSTAGSTIFAGGGTAAGVGGVTSF